ncbi:hypothetical protein B0H34DRAFT_861980 [Crassisporium funariophilum]|nr:hypothetical protein B0H34DRAFT_861980 [Crassisporium funariophilum]
MPNLCHSSLLMRRRLVIISSSSYGSKMLCGPPGNTYTWLVFELEFPDISAARRAHINFKLSFVDIGHWTLSASETGGAAQGAATPKARSIFYTYLYILLPFPPRNSDLIFGRPANAFTSIVFGLESREIPAARRAHINLKLSFVDRRREEQRKALRRPRYTPPLPPSPFRLDIWTSGERFHLDCFCTRISRGFGRAASATEVLTNFRFEWPSPHTSVGGGMCSAERCADSIMTGSVLLPCHVDASLPPSTARTPLTLSVCFPTRLFDIRQTSSLHRGLVAAHRIPF